MMGSKREVDSGPLGDLQEAEVCTLAIYRRCPQRIPLPVIAYRCEHGTKEGHDAENIGRIRPQLNTISRFKSVI